MLGPIATIVLIARYANGFATHAMRRNVLGASEDTGREASLVFPPASPFSIKPGGGAPRLRKNMSDNCAMNNDAGTRNCARGPHDSIIAPPVP